MPKKSEHPGVYLKTRKNADGTTTHRAQVEDPITGTRWVNMTELGLKTKKARKEWAKRESIRLQKKKLQINEGGEYEVLLVEDAIEDYLARCRENLRESSAAAYGWSLSWFKRWAAHKKNRSKLIDVTKLDLARFREWFRLQPRLDAEKNEKRGQRKKSEKKRSPTTINYDLSKIRVFLHDARRLGRVTLDRDTITEQLRGVGQEASVPDYLRPQDLNKLLEACLRHDLDNFAMTRIEKENGVSGETRRYDPVGPFLVFLLLSGCRFGEGATLRWDRVHLREAEIVLKAADVKTKRGRSIDLEITPVLVALLKAMKIQSGEAPFVFGGDSHLSRNKAEKARRRLKSKYGAPKEWTWQQLRVTCASYGSSARSLWGDAAVFCSAKRLGHSVMIAESKYADVVKKIAASARTLEDVMQIGKLVNRIVLEVVKGKEGDGRERETG